VKAQGREQAENAARTAGGDFREWVLSGKVPVGGRVHATRDLLEATRPHQAHQDSPRNLSGGQIARVYEATLFDDAQDLHGMSVDGHEGTWNLEIASDHLVPGQLPQPGQVPAAR
jgi:hypothetical protein